MASYSAKQLARARQSARKRGLRADLYINDWLQTVEDFGGKCAYCGRAYETLDHFIALSQGGGTCIDNCVPCCFPCNQSKRDMPLNKVWSISPEIIERTRQYLASRKPGQRWQAAILALFESQKEVSMEDQVMQLSSEAMQCIPLQLASGKEMYLYSDEKQIVFQLRQLALSDDPLAQSFQVTTLMKPTECVKLALTMLQKATPLLEKEQQREGAFPL